MDFRYSEELTSKDHPTGGLAGTISIRRHATPLKEEIGAIRAQRDWRKLVGPIEGFRGGLSSKYGLMQVAVPECRPERLEIIAYASELGFLYDDFTEFLDHEAINDANSDMQSSFTEGVETGSIDAGSGGLKAMQSILFQEMLEIDKIRATTAMKVWVEFLNEAAGREHTTVHSNFEAYMRYRILDVGEMFWFGLVTFGMALTVPEKDLIRLRELTKPCWVVLALQNDICSYTKEIGAAHQRGVSHIINALSILMRDHHIDLEEAKQICRQHIASGVAEYQRTVDLHKHDATLSRDARIYLEALLYTISGDAAWSLITPRYNSGEAYNELQLSMMRDGWEDASKKRQDNATSTEKSQLSNLHGRLLSSERLAHEKCTENVR